MHHPKARPTQRLKPSMAYTNFICLLLPAQIFWMFYAFPSEQCPDAI
jgi:hypothetical protein